MVFFSGFAPGGEARPPTSIFRCRSPARLIAASSSATNSSGAAERFKDAARAEASYRSFELRYPRSTLAAKSVVEVARLLAAQKRFEDAILTYRKAIGKYPKSDEVMTATVGIADAYRLAGEKAKARRQYEAARAMARDWHDNRYGVDVGKQAWLRGILEYLRQQLSR